MRVGRWLIALFLLVDVIDTIVWLDGIIPEARGLGWLALALVLARALVGSVEGMAAWLLIRREPPARLLASAGLAGAAILTTLNVGLGLAPSDIPPGTRAVVVGVYWGAAAVGAGLLFLRRDRALL